MNTLTKVADQDPAHVDMRERAVALAKLGYPVFRLGVDGKTPIEKNFPAIASIHVPTVYDMWTTALGEPSYHNIGIATGKGLVVIDYDMKKGQNGFAARDAFDKDGMPTSARTDTVQGGQHLILRLPERVIVGSSQKTIAPGVDTRGHNGYIVAPGSRLTGDGDEPPRPRDERPWHGVREYTWSVQKRADELDQVPEWFLPTLLAKSSFRDSPRETQPLVDLDTEEAMARATRYLVNEAPSAIEGNAGDHTTFKVAVRIRDFGISEDVAYTLMLEHWNEDKASPPWSPEELGRKVANAYSYGQDAPGAASPLADFEHHEISGVPPITLVSQQPYDPDWPSPSLVTPYDHEALPDRRFAFKGMFAYGTASALVAPSGAGKTQWLTQAAVALATGRADICGLVPSEPSASTWIWNQEDDQTELRRRLSAAMLASNVSFEDIAGRVFIDSGVDKRLLLAGRDPRTGTIRPTKHVPAMIEAIKRRGVRVLIIDPLVEFHEAEENDNVQMAIVAGVLRRIAVETGCAVVIGVHDRKPDSASSTGHVGNQHAMRGASSVQGVTRAIMTLYGMSSDDARALGVADEDRHRYIRLDGAKNNLALSGGDPVWLKREGQPLREGGTEIGVLKPVELKNRPRVKVEIDRHELVARAIELLGLNDGAWHRWKRVRECLVDEKVWAPEQYLADVTWRRWIADEPTGSVPTTRGVLLVQKGEERAPVMVKLTASGRDECALHNEDDSES